MASEIDYGDFLFEQIIGSADECPEDCFERYALKTLDQFGMSELSHIFLSTGGYMVSTGLLFCQQRDPGVYHQFLLAVHEFILSEWVRISDGTGMIGGYKCLDPVSLSGEDNLFLEAANEIIELKLARKARSVAWGLVRDGLKLCENGAPHHFLDLLAASSTLILDTEMPKSERWPFRVI